MRHPSSGRRRPGGDPAREYTSRCRRSCVTLSDRLHPPPREEAPMSELQQLCDEKGVTITSTYGGTIPEGFSPDSHPYRCTLRYQGRRLTVPFFMGPAHT